MDDLLDYCWSFNALLDVRTCTYVVVDTRYCFAYLKCIFTLALLVLVAEMLV